MGENGEASMMHYRERKGWELSELTHFAARFLKIVEFKEKGLSSYLQ